MILHGRLCLHVGNHAWTASLHARKHKQPAEWVCLLIT